jgi:hypothetical protein
MITDAQFDSGQKDCLTSVSPSLLGAIALSVGRD